MLPMCKNKRTMVNYTVLGQRIRDIRKQKGITVLDWPALNCNVDVNRLMHIESGQTNKPCTLDELASISAALKCHPGELSDYIHPCCMDFQHCQRACVVLVKHLRACLNKEPIHV